MGLQESQTQNGGITFLSVSNGKFVRRVDEGTPNAVSRVNKVGKTVHELFYTSLIGHVKEVTTKESEYGKFWVVKVKSPANDQVYQFEMNYSSGYATSFLKALPNANLEQNVEISPAIVKKDDKSQSVIFLRQDGQAVKHYFTKANPNGMPDLEQIKVKGKITWDDTKRMEFLEKYVQSMFSLSF